MQDKILNNMIEVRIKKSYGIIKESLSRIGIADKKNKKLYPSCYLYENYEKFYIVHFKQLFLLTRNESYDNMTELDYHRLKSIVDLLSGWGLVSPIKPLEYDPTFVYILPFKEKFDWTIVDKFNTKTIKYFK